MNLEFCLSRVDVSFDIKETLAGYEANWHSKRVQIPGSNNAGHAYTALTALLICVLSWQAMKSNFVCAYVCKREKVQMHRHTNFINVSYLVKKTI